MSRMRNVYALWLLTLLFAACSEGPTGPGTGSIEVTSATIGDPTDPDGYTLTLDGEARPIETNATVTLPDVSAGDHELELAGVAANCSLTGLNPRIVAVTSGEVARIRLEIACTEPRGSIDVTTTTTGESLDPDGYRVTLDGGAGQPIGANETITLAAVTAGDHSVVLTGIAPNCTAGPENPRRVTVAEEPVPIGFEVTCGPPTGTIIVSTATAGVSLDSDGYAAVVDGGPGQPIGGNGVLTLSALPVGDHTVGLSGVATNCTVGGENPRGVPVTNGGTTQGIFQVSCFPTGSGTLLYSSDKTGTTRLYSIRQDGSHLLTLTPAKEAYQGDWSPDGSRIAFTSIQNQDDGIFVMDADGSNPTWLGVAGGGPRWSPDRRRILFVSGGGFTTNASIRVMNADGSGVTDLTTGRSPDWSPDGASIVFERTGQCVADLFCSVSLYVMAADGSQVRQLVTSNGPSDELRQPAWSPDGSKIAYTRWCCVFGSNQSGVWVTSLAGGTPTRIDSHSPAGGPVWSPDGSAIAFAAGQSNGTAELMLIPSGGGAGVVLATSNGSEYPTSWK